MNVGQIIGSKGGSVITADPDEPIWGVLRRFRTHQIGVLVVLDGEGRLQGLLGERDLVQGLITHGRNLLDQPVRRVMSTDVATCGVEDTVGQVELDMTHHRARHVPVVDGERTIGIISIGDVVKARLADGALENRVLRDMARSRR